MAEKIVFETIVDISNSQKTVGELREELKGVNTEVQNAAMTWTDFLKEKMGPYMKQFGSHGEAIKQIAIEWKEYKKTGVAALGDVNTGLNTSKTSFNSILTQIRTLEGELYGLTVGTAEYSAKLKEVAELKTKFTQLRQEINALNPEAKLRVFQSLTNTVSSGFTGAISLMASFGIQSEGLQQVLLRIQAVMMFTQAIQSMGELVKVWRIFNLVIAANPILLAATALAALAVAFFATSDSAKEAKDSTKDFTEELENSAKVWKENYDARQRTRKEQFTTGRKELEDEMKERERILKAGGASETEIEKERLLIMKEGLLQGLFSKKEIANQEHEIEVLQRVQGIEDEVKAKEERKKRDDEIKEDLEKTRDEYLMNLKKHGENKVFTEQEINDALLSERERHDLEDEKAAENFDARARAREDKANADFKKAADDKVKIAQHREAAIRLFATTTSDVILRLMQSESDSMAKKLDAKAKMLRAQGKNEQEINKILQADQKRKAEYDKKIALFQIGVSTAQAIAGIVKAVYTKDPDPTGISQAALVAANTLVILGNIVAAKKLLTAVPDEGGGGGELPSLDLGGTGGGGSSAGGGGGGGGGAAPIDINKPLLSTTTGTGTIVGEQGQFIGFAGQGQAQGQQQSTQEQLNALQVYVVESDIKNVFKKVDLIEQKAKF